LALAPSGGVWGIKMSEFTCLQPEQQSIQKNACDRRCPVGGFKDHGADWVSDPPLSSGRSEESGRNQLIVLAELHIYFHQKM
jgi:hypothetical protein